MIDLVLSISTDALPSFSQNELQDEMQKYRDYLATQAQEEEKREKELDALVNAEVQKQWAKRVEQWRMERQARKKLMQDVLDTRKKQIQERCMLSCTCNHHANQKPSCQIIIIMQS